MLRRWVGSCLVALVTLLPQQAPANQVPKMDPRGAVLCIWMIYASIHAIGENCAPKQDRDFLDFLQSGIDRMNAFIIRNSDTTQAALDERQNQIRARQAQRGTASCELEGESMALYNSLKSVDPSQSTANMDKLLEVDREPLLNPCL
ncbi:conserved exported hypothetical protein [Mesorhizobium delmotii]|uniref:Uncharacterized protein n=2 Tax=Mesorhizobium delmotii TaxID=1631247 RepID=A0A2P9AW94_9HYPH|nr:conserved exported hypothetical protein [Mesorhizobium delmotii]